MSLKSVSIIIPVYNSAEWIGQTLESCLAIVSVQTEIICINDGSTDDTLTILEQYAQSHNHIRVISKKNEGPGASRNLGIKQAKYEYIWFIDSDDIVLSNVANTVLESISGNYDMFAFKANNRFDGNTKPRQTKFIKPEYSCKDVLQQYLYTVNVTLYLFKRSWLVDQNILFPKLKSFEDTTFILLALINGNKLRFIDQTLYQFNIRFNSNSRHQNHGIHNEVLASIQEIKKLRSIYINDQVIKSSIEKELSQEVGLLLNKTRLIKPSFYKACSAIKSDIALIEILQSQQKIHHKIIPKLINLPEILRLLFIFKYRKSKI